MNRLMALCLPAVATFVLCCFDKAYAQSTNDDDLYRIQRQQEADARRRERESQDRARVEEGRRQSEDRQDAGQQREPGSSQTPVLFPPATIPQSEPTWTKPVNYPPELRPLQEVLHAFYDHKMQAEPAYRRYEASIDQMSLWEGSAQVRAGYPALWERLQTNLGDARWAMAELASLENRDSGPLNRQAIGSYLTAYRDTRSDFAAQKLEMFAKLRASSIPPDLAGEVQSALSAWRRTRDDRVRINLITIDDERRRMAAMIAREAYEKTPAGRQAVATAAAKQYLFNARMQSDPRKALIEAELALINADSAGNASLSQQALAIVSKKRSVLSLSPEDPEATLRDVRTVALKSTNDDAARRQALNSMLDSRQAEASVRLAETNAQFARASCLADLARFEKAFVVNDESPAVGYMLASSYVQCGTVQRAMHFLDAASASMPPTLRADWWTEWTAHFKQCGFIGCWSGAEPDAYVRAASDRLRVACAAAGPRPDSDGCSVQ